MAGTPDLGRLEHGVNELLQLAHDQKRELQTVLDLAKRNQQQIAEVRESTVHAIELITRLETLHQDTQEHVKRALEIVADIHPHIRRIPEIHQATEDLKEELRSVKAAAADASRQLHDYSQKLEADQDKSW